MWRTLARVRLSGGFRFRTVGLDYRTDVLSPSEGVFVDRILSDMPSRPANYEDVIASDLGHQTADDEEAFCLEPGPNNCAASQGSLVL